MRALIACEESQVVCKAFRERGHEAYSCDLIPCSGGHTEWHIQGDVRSYLDEEWDILIGFPPCTFLSSVQTFLCRKDSLRVMKRIHAAEFFMCLYNAPINKICIENPTGVMTHIFRPADQVIHPFYFGDKEFKRTCLWLKNLPLLIHQKENTLFQDKTHEKPKEPIKTWVQKSTGMVKNQRHINTPFLSAKERSKLSPFIAKAMAEQWG